MSARAQREPLDEMGKRSIELELLGHRLTVVSDTDEAEVRDIVEFVQDRLETIRQATRHPSSDQIALLAALNIAEALFAERRKTHELRTDLRARSVELLGAIDTLADEVDVVCNQSSNVPCSVRDD